LACGGIAIATAVGIYFGLRWKRRQALYGTRRRIDADEYYDRYFKEPVGRTVVTAVLRGLNYSWLDFSRIDPDERFETIGDLLWGDEWEDIQGEVELGLGLKLDDVEPFDSPRQLIEVI